MAINKKSVINYLFHMIIFYGLWFFCFYAVHQKNTQPAIIISLFLFVLQYLWQYFVMQNAKYFFRMILILAGTGFMVDTLLFNVNFIDFSDTFLFFAPLWLLMLWIEFAIFYFATFQAFFESYSTLALFGLIGFPLAYAAGVRFSAATLHYGYPSVFLYGLIWAVLLPLCTKIYSSTLPQKDPLA